MRHSIGDHGRTNSGALQFAGNAWPEGIHKGPNYAAAIVVPVLGGQIGHEMIVLPGSPGDV